MIHVACAADEAYLPHCAAMLLSLFECHVPAAVTVHFLHGEDLPRHLRDPLAAIVEESGAHLRFHAFADETVAGLSSPPGVRPLMWYRTMLPERLPELDRILYLDADTLVVDDLRPLWNEDMRGCVLAAVTNVTPRMHRSWPAKLGIADPQCYFNSGVMLMDLARLRADDAASRLIGYGRGRDLMWWDQDALNVIYGGQRLPLHPRWNCMNTLFLLPEARETFGPIAVAEACRDPAIVHFEGPGATKPWHYLCKHPYRGDYLRHRAASPWPLLEFEGRTAFNRLLRPLPMRAIVEALGARYRLERAVRQLGRRVRGQLVHERRGS
jgi:lipopolysaccharide biosynthesis glycosyltransferase